MRVTIAAHSATESVLALDVPPDISVGSLKAIIQSDTNIVPAMQILHFNGLRLTDDNATLEAIGASDGDMLSMTVQITHASSASRRSRPAQGTNRATRTTQDDADEAERWRLRLMMDANLRASANQERPALAEAIDNPSAFREQYSSMLNERAAAARQHDEAARRLNADPMDVDAQKEIEESIRLQNVMENLQFALDHAPEAFGHVNMLYIDVEVNNHKVKAFVDSGAQTTVMSPSCAESCAITRLIDTRFSGIARGVGTAKIIGKVHSAPIKIGDLNLPCSFTVMEGKDVDLLLGLDMLKRYQASIDLKRNCLVIEGREIPFLGEADLPTRFQEVSEPTVDGPAGMKIGGISGTILPPDTSTESGTIPLVENQNRATSSFPIPSSQASPAQSVNQLRFPEAHIDQLVALGFTRDEAVNALEMVNGNLEEAAGLLYS